MKRIRNLMLGAALSLLTAVSMAATVDVSGVKMEVERRLAAHLMACWERGASSLRAEAEPTGRPHLAAA